MCQMRGAIQRTTLLKNAKGRLYLFFNLSPCLIFPSPNCQAKLLTGVPLEILTIVSRFLEHKFVRALLLPTFGFVTACRIGGLKNEA